MTEIICEHECSLQKNRKCKAKRIKIAKGAICLGEYTKDMEEQLTIEKLRAEIIRIKELAKERGVIIE